MSISESVAGTISICAVGIYILRTLVFMAGAARERRRLLARGIAGDSLKKTALNAAQGKEDYESDYTPFVSVVVPARNEEDNIESCVRALMASAYPEAMFEVVVVNDRSSDRTGVIVSALQEEFSNLVVHNTLDDRTNSNLQGKARAVHQGIMRSKGEIVLMTDADCIVAPTWIRTMSSIYARPSVGLVASFTIVRGKRLFDTLQMLEWMINNTMASAGVGLGQPLGCFGNNLSVRRSVYDELGGYERIRFSVTEDLALLQAVHNAGHEVRYICHNGSKVETLPCPDLATFAKQHHRWVNGGKALGWRGQLFVVSSVIFWIGIAIALLYVSWQFALCLIGARIVANMLLTLPSFYEFKMLPALLQMPLAEPFFLAIEIAMPLWAMQSHVEWKGQILRNH